MSPRRRGYGGQIPNSLAIPRQHLRRLAVAMLVAPLAFWLAPAHAAAESVPLPTGADSTQQWGLYATSCPAAGDCVGVGDYTDMSGRLQGLLLDQSNGSWSASTLNLSALPSIDATASGIYLESLDCPSVGNCSVFGSYADASGADQALVVSQTGGSWGPAAEVPAPTGAASGPEVQPYAISCATAGNCVAVGRYQDSSGYNQGLLLTETNGTWTSATAPLPDHADSNPDADLYAVSCASAGACVAVGQYDTGGVSEGLVLTESGGVWTPTEATTAGLLEPPASNPQIYLTTVACPTVGNCTAAGEYTGLDTHAHGLLLTESAGAWHATEEDVSQVTDPAERNVSPQSVACASAANCLVVGLYHDTEDVDRDMYVTETNGVWAPMTEVGPPADTTESGVDAMSLTSVACSDGGNCLAGGFYESYDGMEGIILSHQGNAWTSASVVLGAGANNEEYSAISSACAPGGYCILGGYYHYNSSDYAGLLLTAPGPAASVSPSAAVDQASVSWSAPADDGGFPVTGYTVTANDTTDAARGGQSTSVGSSTLSAAFTGLTAGDSYTFTVTATSLLGIGVGASSSAVTIAGPPPATVAAPTRAQIVATLKQVLKPTGKNSTLKKILENKGFTFKYRALEAGRLVIDWYYVTKKEKGKGKHRHKVKVKTLVAKANVKIAAARTYTVKVKLTKAGKRLLETHKRLKLTAQAGFTPTGGKPITTTETFTLR